MKLILVLFYFVKFSFAYQEVCRDRIREISENDFNTNNPKKISTMEFLLSLTPQLMSIICFLILLIFYSTIGELKKTIYGKCWINFIINSMTNYLGTIVVLVLARSEMYWEDSVSKDIIILLLAITIWIILIFTEFSLYFWLNITFFEAFYTIR